MGMVLSEVLLKYALTLLIALCLLAPPRLARAADEIPASKDEIKKLIDQLGAGEYARREEAAKKIKAIGKPALPALKQAITDGEDAEIVSRAQALVRRIEIRPLPAPDPALINNGMIPATRMRLGVNNNNRVLEVTEGGRDIKIDEGPDGITLSVTGLVDGQHATEEYTAKDVDQLKSENPEAHALYQRWAAATRGTLMLGGRMRIGGQVQIGGAFIQPMPTVPDELEHLRTHLEKQMKESKLKEDQRAQVAKGIDQLVDIRNSGLDIPMGKYSEQCDELRKTLEQYKLDPGEFLPPPAKTRLGVSVSPVVGHLTVQQIGEKSRAERIGLQLKDQIRKIDGKEIATVAELRKAVAAREKGLIFEITRDGDDLKLEEPEEKPAK